MNKQVIDKLLADLDSIHSDASWALEDDSSQMENRLNNIRDTAKFAPADLRAELRSA